MDRRQLLWQLTADQFAAFDTQLYLDTHPNDKAALQIFNHYRNSFAALKKEYEESYGPISMDNTASGSWDWLKDPWPWEKGAN